MTRVYLPVGAVELRRLAGGESVTVEGYVAASADEQDELDALGAAADEAPAVAVAETDDPDGPITIDVVQSLHAAVDDSGDLAWFATQEIAAVIDVVTDRAPWTRRGD